jgi:hypothetical protein
MQRRENVACPYSRSRCSPRAIQRSRPDSPEREPNVDAGLDDGIYVLPAIRDDRNLIVVVQTRFLEAVERSRARRVER